MNSLQVKVRLGGTEALKNLLLEKNCLGFLPQRSVSKELKNGELVEIDIEGIDNKRNFYFIQRKGEPANELGKSMVSFAKAVYNLEL